VFALLFCSPLAFAQTKFELSNQVKGILPGGITALTTGSPYTVLAADRGKLITVTSASAYGITLAQANTAGFTAGAIFHVKNLGVGAVTITPTTSTIDGNATLVLTTGQGVDIYSDGANYNSQAGSGTDIRSITYIAGADNTTVVLADADDQATIWVNDTGKTFWVTRVWVQSDGGTPIVNIARDDGSAANILTTSLTAATGNGVCGDSSGASMAIRGTSITCSNYISATEKIILAGHALNFVMVTAGGTAKRATVNVQLTGQ
jgi:hypothetical protein